MAEQAHADEVEPATIEDLAAIVDDRSEFWGERDLSLLHHPLLVHDFGETALVMRDGDRRVVAYLFGLLTPARVGYIHLVAVREGRRRAGLGRCLYSRFEALVRERGAVALKAFTRTSNVRSIAFHRSLGFTVTDTPDYAGPGEARTVFWKELSDGAGQP
jgi:ribosomal protein S18 acetylase RimI-like enzyme